MDLEEHTLDDNLARRCAVCGVPLTEAEIHEAREAGGAFVCSVHAAEELPVALEADGDTAEPVD